MAGQNRVENEVERSRRAWVERQETFKDREEDFLRDKAAARTAEERGRLSQEFAEYRRAHRQEDVDQGRRSAGMSIAMHQIMWARWAEVAVEHEIVAREAFNEIAQGSSEALLRDFRASLVAITGAAYAIDALFGDLKYLIPAPTTRRNRDVRLWRGFCDAFGILPAEAHRLLRELRWLFELRDHAAHSYTEAEPPQRHPAGVTTGAETSRFNAVASGRAVDAMLGVLHCAANPVTPLNRWVERWVVARAAHHETVIDPLAERRAAIPALVLSNPLA